MVTRADAREIIRAAVTAEECTWVDKQDYRLVKAEVEVIDTIWVGVFLVRLANAWCAAFEQFRVNDEVWPPRRVQAFLSARLGLLKVLHIEQEMIYSQARHFIPLPSSSRNSTLSRRRSN